MFFVMSGELPSGKLHPVVEVVFRSLTLISKAFFLSFFGMEGGGLASSLQILR